MSVKFEFYMNDVDTDRLFAVKKSKGKDTLTGNEFARELLEDYLYKMHPKVPEFDENGIEI